MEIMDELLGAPLVRNVQRLLRKTHSINFVLPLHKIITIFAHFNNLYHKFSLEFILEKFVLFPVAQKEK